MIPAGTSAAISASVAAVTKAFEPQTNTCFGGDGMRGSNFRDHRRIDTPGVVGIVCRMFARKGQGKIEIIAFLLERQQFIPENQLVPCPCGIEQQDGRR